MITITGRPLIINGTGTVPVGLFGVHATALDAARIADWGVTSVRLIHQQPSGAVLQPEQVHTGLVHLVECLYDRYQPALLLTDPEWRRTLGALAEAYAASARASGRQHLLEFWNEPYLNWSCKPGVNYDGRHYDLAGAADGAPVALRGEATEHLRWRRGLLAHEAESGAVAAYVPASYAPRTAKAGDTYVFRGRTYEMREVWMAHDPTQEFYWAGRQNELWYRRMFRVFAEALKRANPDIQLAAGWGFNLWNEGWECWHRLVRPLLDDCLPLMDALHEHHYGNDTRLVAASYEVATAYTDERGRRLRFWNTEAGGMLDPQQPDTPRPGLDGGPLQRAVGAMTYMLRDVIHLVDMCPDKAAARAAHEAERNGGDEFAFRLLKPLRGELVAVDGTDHQRWCVASRDGATLAVVCFNDGRGESAIPLRVVAPPGCMLAGARLLAAQPRGDGQGLELHEQRLEAAGPAWEGSLVLPPMAARTLVFTLAGAAAPAPAVRIDQHFAHGVLAVVPPGGCLRRRIPLPPAALATAVRARLKLVVADQDEGCSLSLNGTPLPMPPRGTWTTRQEIPPDRLGQANELVFRAGERPLRVLMASIELISDG